MNREKVVENLLAELEGIQKTEEALKEAAKTTRPLAEMLSRARLERHISQKDLAEQTGFKQSLISRIEGGKANPTLRTIQRVVEALDKRIVLIDLIQ